MRYIVVNENTLAYVDETPSSLVGVLAGSVIKGGHNWLDGPISIGPGDNARIATPKDFADYRVDVRGHL